MRNFTRILLAVLSTFSIALLGFRFYNVYSLFTADPSNTSAVASSVSHGLISTALLLLLFLIINLVIIISLFKYITLTKKSIALYLAYSVIMILNGSETIMISAITIIILGIRIFLHNRRKTETINLE